MAVPLHRSDDRTRSFCSRIDPPTPSGAATPVPHLRCESPSLAPEVAQDRNQHPKDLAFIAAFVGLPKGLGPQSIERFVIVAARSLDRTTKLMNRRQERPFSSSFGSSDIHILLPPRSCVAPRAFPPASEPRSRLVRLYRSLPPPARWSGREPVAPAPDGAAGLPVRGS